MGWFETLKSPKLKVQKKFNTNTPSGLWKKCVSCGEIMQSVKLEQNNQVCPYCDHHFRIDAQSRIDMLMDNGSFKPFDTEFHTRNPLKFVDKKDYDIRLKDSREKTGMTDGILAGLGKVDGQEVSIAVMDFRFMGGSMGAAIGEQIAQAMDRGYQKKIPVVVISSSGGARMQEGIVSLMQMAKTSAARKRLANANIPYISVLTDPTTGGCAASFAMLGDLNIAEPKALIGFAGPRVIEQSILQTLPAGFQRSEFLLEHGFIDRIVHRKDMKKELSFFIQMFSK